MKVTDGIVFAEKAIVYHPRRRDKLLPHVFRHLFYVRNDWITFIRHPTKYLKYIGLPIKDWVKTIYFYSSLTLIIFLFKNNEYLLSLTVYLASLIIFLITMFKLVGFSFKSHLDFNGVNDMILFPILNFFKFIAYPFFFVYSFFHSLLVVDHDGYLSTKLENIMRRYIRKEADNF